MTTKPLINDWSAYFAAQETIRTAAGQKAAAIEQRYADMPPSVGPITMMARLNQMIGEIATVNEVCEADLAKVKKPTAEGVRA